MGHFRFWIWDLGLLGGLLPFHKAHRRTWEIQRASIAQLQRQLEELEAHGVELESRQQQLRMRDHLTQAQQALAESLYGERDRWQVELAEETVRQQAYTADAYQALVRPPAGLSDIPSPAERLEITLTLLRGELGLPGPEEKTNDL